MKVCHLPRKQGLFPPFPPVPTSCSHLKHLETRGCTHVPTCLAFSNLPAVSQTLSRISGNSGNSGNKVYLEGLSAFPPPFPPQSVVGTP